LDEFRDFRQDTADPEYIVIGDNRSKFDFEHLNQALRLLLKGKRLIGMQSELLDSSMGELELNVGSWVGMLERASGVQATYIGKPNPYVFELALHSMGLDKSRVVMVGDRLQTDVKGAKNFGIRSLLLRTGEFRENDLDGSLQPDFVFDSIRDIFSIL
jgi:HAD superfamily hydrolase (TIGR01450 family)